MSDLISRAALFNALATAQDKGEIFAAIQNAPAVDAVPVVHGKCKYDKETREYVCSECGRGTCGYFDTSGEAYETPFGFGKGHRIHPPHYCKHCGAKMDEEVNH